MKRFIILLGMIMLFSSGAFAEIKQGHLMVLSSTNINYTKSTISQSRNSSDSKITMFSSEILYPFTDDFGIGLSTGVSNLTTDTDTVKNIISAVHARVFFESKGQVNPYFSAGFGSLRTDNNTSSLSGTGIIGQVGFLYFLNNSIALDVNYSYVDGNLNGYLNSSAKENFTYTQSSVNIGFAFTTW